jgi:hypothetical protein
MKAFLCSLVTAFVIWQISAETAQAATNYITCEVYVTNTSGRLALEVTGSPWQLGVVPQGGVKETWTQGGPGKFKVTNSGDAPALVRIVTGAPSSGGNTISPTNAFPGGANYVLAFATNVTEVLPVWNRLTDLCNPIPEGLNSPAYGANICPLLAGEYQLLDLKFWAPVSSYPLQTCTFRVKFEAIALPPP